MGQLAPIEKAQEPMAEQNVEAEQLLRSAIEQRRLNKEFVKSHQFNAALDWLEPFLGGGDQAERAKILALFGHVAESSAPARKAVAPRLQKMGGEPIMPIGLSGPKDREYFAKALTYIASDWRKESAAQFLVRSDPSASRVSTPLFEILSADTKDASELADFALSHFEQWKRGQGISAGLINRKSEQIFSGICDLIYNSDKNIGDQDKFGNSISRLIISGFDNNGPDKFDKANDFAISILSSMRSLISFRFRDVVTIGALYKVPKRVIGWWAPGSPPADVERVIMQVADEGFGALHLFALQGVNDRALRTILVDAFGVERVKLAFNRSAKADPRLSRDSTRWLAEGVEPRSTPRLGSAQALSEEALDELIATALLAQVGGGRASADLEAIADALEGRPKEHRKTKCGGSGLSAEPLDVTFTRPWRESEFRSCDPRL
jgi:hypothetical protein